MPGSGAGMAAIQFKSNTADLRGMRVDDGLGVLDNALNRMANSGTQVSRWQWQQCPPYSGVEAKHRSHTTRSQGVSLIRFCLAARGWKRVLYVGCSGLSRV